MREIRLHFMVAVNETNAAKLRCLPGSYRDAKLAQRCQAVGHDALAARFVDGRLRAVHDGDVKTRLSSCDSGRQSSWSSACDEHLGMVNGFVHCLYQRSSTSSEQKPGPMAARRP